MAHEPYPRIVITAGEPAGIGPDLCVLLVQQAHPAGLVVIADRDVLAQRARQLNLPLALSDYESTPAPAPQSGGALKILHLPAPAPVVAGTLDRANARYVLDTLRRAALGCVNGEFAALVTGPVHKGVINDAGFPFSGHTEFLAELTRTPQVVMLLAADKLRVALATTHLPLSEVSKAITPTLLRSVLRVLHAELMQRFGIAQPRILICGLNPHAGEGGHLGREEIDVIIPVLDQLRREGMRLTGPLPADTLFTPRYLNDADAVLALYHDQGLPVLKYAGFGRAVNITLGLPIIRTSVDHGTALDLAGTGKADVGSLEVALQTAIEMATQ